MKTEELRKQPFDDNKKLLIFLPIWIYFTSSYGINSCACEFTI